MICLTVPNVLSIFISPLVLNASFSLPMGVMIFNLVKFAVDGITEPIVVESIWLFVIIASLISVLFPVGFTSILSHISFSQVKEPEIDTDLPLINK